MQSLYISELLLSIDMPHFASMAMITRYGHEELLDFTYYLKQARPTSAFTVYAITLICRQKKRVSARRYTAIDVVQCTCHYSFL